MTARISGEQVADCAFDQRVEAIWDDFDLDQNGCLDQAEMKIFMMNMLSKFEMIQNYNDEDFNRVLATIDTNGDGMVSKQEMNVFLRRMSGK